MSKKKDPKEAAFMEALKANDKLLKQNLKLLKKDEVMQRVAQEHHDLTEKAMKLGHFLWTTKTTENGDEISVYTEAAKVINGKHRQLLIRQHKAMCVYADILNKRISLVTQAEVK